MFRYRLHSPDGDDLGEATYAMQIKPERKSTSTPARSSGCSTLSRSRKPASWASSGCSRSRPSQIESADYSFGQPGACCPQPRGEPREPRPLPVTCPFATHTSSHDHESAFPRSLASPFPVPRIG